MFSSSQVQDEKNLGNSCGAITLAKIITHAKGGDLILIQDQAYIDNYTRLNSQEAHHIKHFFRFKQKENPKSVV